MLARFWSKGTSYGIDGNIIWYSHYGKHQANSLKNNHISNKTTVWSSYPTSGYLSNKYENTNSKRHTHAFVHLSIIYNGQDMETKCPSMNKWIKNVMVIYIHSHKKDETLPFATIWMDLEGIIMLSEIS